MIKFVDLWADKQPVNKQSQSQWLKQKQSKKHKWVGSRETAISKKILTKTSDFSVN